MRIFQFFPEISVKKANEIFHCANITVSGDIKLKQIEREKPENIYDLQENQFENISRKEFNDFYRLMFVVSVAFVLIVNI